MSELNSVPGFPAGSELEVHQLVVPDPLPPVALRGLRRRIPSVPGKVGPQREELLPPRLVTLRVGSLLRGRERQPFVRSEFGPCISFKVKTRYSKEIIIPILFLAL